MRHVSRSSMVGGMAYLIVLAVASGTSDAQDVDLVRQVRDAWRARQEQAVTVQCEFTEQRFFPGGTLHATGATSAAVTDDVRKADKYRLLLKDTRLFRVERSGEEWYSDVATFVLRDYVNSYDDSNAKSFYSKTESMYPTGFMYSGQSDWDNRHLLPILWHFRPFNTEFAPYNDEPYVVSSEEVLVNARMCRVFKPARNDGDVAFVYYVEQANEWTVVRYEKRMGGTTLWSIDVSYSDVAGFGLAPTSWTEVLMRVDGNIKESSETTVKDMTINGALDREAFVFEFPVGTLVTDRTGAGRPEVYLVTANGGRRIVTRNERLNGIQYDRYLNTASGTAVDSFAEPQGRNWLVISINGLIVIILSVWWYYARIR